MHLTHSQKLNLSWSIERAAQKMACCTPEKKAGSKSWEGWSPSLYESPLKAKSLSRAL